MISNTNTFNIDGKVLEEDQLKRIFSFNSDDKFSHWVLRPLAVLTALGLGTAMLFASALLIMVALAMVPILAVFFWAAKTKMDRDLAQTKSSIFEDSGTFKDSGNREKTSHDIQSMS